MTKTDSDETKVALINNNIGFIQKDIAEMKSDIKALAGIYITKLEFEDLKRLTEDKIAQLQKQSNLWRWLSPTLTAVLTAFITFLVLEFLKTR